jgi:hypothetical protein
MYVTDVNKAQTSADYSVSVNASASLVTKIIVSVQGKADDERE